MTPYLPPLSRIGWRWVRFGGVALGVILLVVIIYELRAVFTPLLAAFAIAYIFNPVVTWLERRGVRRLLSVAAFYLVGIVCVLAGLLSIGSLTIAQIAELKQNIGPIITRLGEFVALIDRNLDRLGELWPITTTTAPASQPVAMALDSIGGPPATSGAPAEAPAPWWPTASALLETRGSSIATTALAWVSAIASDIPALVALFVLVPMYGFFFLWRFNDIVDTIRTHLPAKSRDTVVDVFRTIDSSTSNFFRGRLIVCCIIGTLNGIGWQIVGVRFGLLLGVLSGVFNLVPYLSNIVLPVAVLFAYLGATDRVPVAGDGSTWFWPVVLTLAVFLAVQALESFVLSPVIESRTSGLHPVTTVIALLIGADLAGLLGMLLAIPTASTLKALTTRWVLPEIRRLAGLSPPAGAPPPDAGRSQIVTAVDAPPVVQAPAELVKAPSPAGP